MDYINAAALIVARTVIYTVVAATLWAVAPIALGWTPTVVVSGSMEPGVPTGSILLSAPVEPSKLAPGHVLLADEPGHPGVLLSHRMVGWENGEIVTRGDANPARDSSTIPVETVHGVGRLLVPYAGSLSVWWRSGDVDALALAAGLVAASGYVMARGGRIGGRRTVAAAAVVAALAGSLSLHPAHAAFTAVTANPASSWSLAPLSSWGPSEYTLRVQESSPLHYLRLDETAGLLGGSASNIGTSGASGTYTLTGAAAATGCTPRETNRAVTFNGLLGSVAFGPTSTPPASLTLEAWIRTTSTSGGQIVGFEPTSGSISDRHLYITGSGAVTFGAVTAGGLVTVGSRAGYNDGACHHVAAVVANGIATVYVDGAVATGSVPVPLVTYPGRWIAGGGSLLGLPGVSGNLAGVVDEVAVYSSALSSSAINTHYTAV